MTVKGAHPLHQALFAAIEANNADAFNALAGEHFDEIMAQFDSWATVPAAIRADQSAASRYVESLLAIAQVFEAAGEPALMERLIGTDESNPILQWNRRLGHAQALSEAGEYAESNRQLERILAEMEGATGSAVDGLRPKILGTLGANALHRRDYATALEFNQRAYEGCIATEDEEGMVTYYENLMSLRAIELLNTEPERGRRLLDLRRLIALAQDSTDAGRYQASIDTLSQALSLIQPEDEDERFRALLPKGFGLLAFNQYKLGKVAQAREHTRLALQKAEEVGDKEGVRIYTANLEVLDSQ